MQVPYYIIAFAIQTFIIVLHYMSCWTEMMHTNNIPPGTYSSEFRQYISTGYLVAWSCLQTFTGQQFWVHGQWTSRGLYHEQYFYEVTAVDCNVKKSSVLGIVWRWENSRILETLFQQTNAKQPNSLHNYRWSETNRSMNTILIQ